MAAPLKRVMLDPVSENNPIMLQVLGICSALAVTVKMETSIVMAMALTMVVTVSSLVISLLRNTIPSRIRMIVEMVVISTLVIIADQFLRAFFFDISRQLSVFVGLIITNCIVMGRLEAFAMQNKPLPSLLDGMGNGLGYGLVLVLVAVARELLGSGKLMGYPVIPQALYDAGYVDNGLLLLAPGAFLVLGLLIWLHRTLIGHTEAE
jgi:Na+-transporting NADH:ubiquinone oxidoreductase subunit D